MSALPADPAPLLLPPPLAPGDAIGIVAPAGPVLDRQAFDAGIDLLKARGYQVVIRDGVLAQDRHLAGPDEHRLSEFLACWRDPAIKAVMAARGGFGCLRLLPRLPLARLARSPKRFIGFSDLTSLLAPICRRARMITWHGPVVTSLSRLDQPSLEALWMAFSGPAPRLLEAQLAPVVPGVAVGCLAGGNLTCLAHLIGTRYEPDWNGSILFLEDVNEPEYRIDRLLTHLDLSGRLRRVRGIVLGDFHGPDGSPLTPDFLRGRVRELTGDAIPIAADAPIGHGRRNHALPLGVSCALDGGQGTLRLLDGSPAMNE